MICEGPLGWHGHWKEERGLKCETLKSTMCRKAILVRVKEGGKHHGFDQIRERKRISRSDRNCTGVAEHKQANSNPARSKA